MVLLHPNTYPWPWTEFLKLGTTQPAQQPVTVLVTLPRAEDVSLRKHGGNKTQINPKVQQLSELSLFSEH